MQHEEGIYPKEDQKVIQFSSELKNVSKFPNSTFLEHENAN